MIQKIIGLILVVYGVIGFFIFKDFQECVILMLLGNANLIVAYFEGYNKK